MKQYTTDDQTAKLIGLGFEKPKNTRYVQRAKARNLHSPFIEFGEPEFEGSYSIGELIEMLPEEIPSDMIPEGLEIYVDHYKIWTVSYCNVFGELYNTYSGELVDALYDMIIKLKEKCVI